MKTKILMSVLAIGLAIALIGGATMAWFTAEADVNPATFTAGTVIVNADGPGYFPAEGKFFDNVNPGDCGRVKWTIINEGTKAAEIRVKLEEAWEDDGLSTENFFYAPAPNSDWVMYYEEEEGEDKGIWLYYTGGPVAGTYGLGEGEAPESVELELVVAFDGELTDDDYQGLGFTLGGKVYAIQASNDAPLEVWGEAWDVVTQEGYEPSGLAATYLNYIKDTKCWNGEQEPAMPLSFKAKFNSTGSNSGSPTTPGWHSGTVYIKDAKGSDDQNFTGQVTVVVTYAGDEWEFPGVTITDGKCSFETGKMQRTSGGFYNSTQVKVKIGDVVGEQYW